MTAPAPLMTPRDWGLLALLSVLWGGSFLFNRVAVAEIPPLTLTFERVALASAALFLMLRLTGRAVPTGRDAWTAFFGMGLINNVVPFTLIAYGQKELGAGLASVLNATTPLFTVIVAHMLTRDERMTPAKLAGVVLGVVGVAVLMGIDRFGFGAHLWAELACLGATLSYAFSNIYGRRFRRMDIDPMRATFGQVTASACILLLPALLVDRPWSLPVPGPAALACVAALGILSTAVAYQLFYRVLASAGATAVSLVTLMIPPTAILLGALVLGERLEARQVAGAALIGLGLLVVDGRLVALLRRRAGDAA